MQADQKKALYEEATKELVSITEGETNVTLGCLRIPIGRGVCGTAASTLETQLVADVHAFPGHIACDSRSNSEIVVPVVNADGQLIAVLDVDSVELNSFDEIDRVELETLMQRIFAQ